jgi:hypothetical protein
MEIQPPSPGSRDSKGSRAWNLGHKQEQEATPFYCAPLVQALDIQASLGPWRQEVTASPGRSQFVSNLSPSRVLSQRLLGHLLSGRRGNKD